MYLNVVWTWNNRLMYHINQDILSWGRWFTSVNVCPLMPEYCWELALWHHIYAAVIVYSMVCQMFQFVQNMAAGIITTTLWHSHVTLVHEKLHWSPFVTMIWQRCYIGQVEHCNLRLVDINNPLNMNNDMSKVCMASICKEDEGGWKDNCFYEVIEDSFF